MKRAIVNGRIIDPANNVDDIVDLYIDGSVICAIGQRPVNFEVEQEIDATDLHVIPGVIDLCARLKEPGEEHKATIASETFAAVSGGITQMVCPPDTFPVIDTPAMVHMIRDRAEDSGYAKVQPLGALTVGLKGERLTDMAMLMDAGCVGVSNALQAVENTLVMRRAMQYASTYDLPVFLTPKDPWLQGNGCVHEGEISTRLGLPAVPVAAETVGVARDLALIETSGARAHFDLISCKRSLQMISEARDRGLPVTVSTSIHHLHLCETDINTFDTRYKVMPPLRTREDRDALVQGVADGSISAICSDHQPHGNDAKLAPFSEAASGIAGLDSLLALTLALVNEKQLSLHQAIAALTRNPARILGLDGGQLSVGSTADICLYDPNREWILEENGMMSSGTNSPFIGKSLRGAVVTTLINGRIVFSQRTTT